MEYKTTSNKLFQPARVKIPMVLGLGKESVRIDKQGRVCSVEAIKIASFQVDLTKGR
jgi:hypothetical protein